MTAFLTRHPTDLLTLAVYVTTGKKFTTVKLCALNESEGQDDVGH